MFKIHTGNGTLILYLLSLEWITMKSPFLTSILELLMMVQGESIEKCCLSTSGTAIITVINDCHRVPRVQTSFIYDHSVYLWSKF